MLCSEYYEESLFHLITIISSGTLKVAAVNYSHTIDKPAFPLSYRYELLRYGSYTLQVPTGGLVWPQHNCIHKRGVVGGHFFHLRQISKLLYGEMPSDADMIMEKYSFISHKCVRACVCV